MLKTEVKIDELKIWFERLELTILKFPYLAEVIRILREKESMPNFEQQFNEVYSVIIANIPFERTIYNLQCWRNYMQILKERLESGFNLNEIMAEFKEMWELKIVLPNRFNGSKEVWEELLNNRRDLEKGELPDKPLAILIFPLYDIKGAFVNFTGVESIISHGYYGLYYEVKSLDELLKALADSTINIGIKASVILFCGHGTPVTVDDYINTSDFSFLNSMKKFGIGNCLEDAGTVIICACSTGKGEDKNLNNVANVISEIFPQAEHIFAPTRNTGGIERIDFSPENRITYIGYFYSDIYDARQDSLD